MITTKDTETDVKVVETPGPRDTNQESKRLDGASVGTPTSFSTDPPLLNKSLIPVGNDQNTEIQENRETPSKGTNILSLLLRREY